MRHRTVTAVGALGHPIQAMKLDQHLATITVTATATAVPLSNSENTGDYVVAMSLQGGANSGAWIRFNHGGDTTVATATNSLFIPRNMILFFTLGADTDLSVLRQAGNSSLVIYRCATDELG